MKKKRPFNVVLKERLRNTMKALEVVVFSILFPPAIRFITNTWRIQENMAPETRQLLESGDPVIFAIWHGRMYSVIRGCNPKQTTILISPSRDGDMIAKVMANLGFKKSIRGSHQRKGTKALLEMNRELKEEKRSLIFMVDGPRGPRYQVKPGIVKLASLTGIPIVPIISSNRRFLTIIKQSWDHFHFPQLFTRMQVDLGKPIYIPEGLKGAEEVEQQRHLLESTMLELTEQLDRQFGNYLENQEPAAALNT